MKFALNERNKNHFTKTLLPLDARVRQTHVLGEPVHNPMDSMLEPSEWRPPVGLLTSTSMKVPLNALKEYHFRDYDSKHFRRDVTVQGCYSRGAQISSDTKIVGSPASHQ